MCEHWSLIVDQSSQASWNEFLSGNCRTVGVREAIRRLRQICNQNVRKEAEREFSKISAHRNRIIHFFHDVGAGEAKGKLVEDIAREQCRCWFHLDHLLCTWTEEFVRFQQEISEIRWAIKSNRHYLDIAFDRLKAQIDRQRNAGAVFCMCSSCGHESARVDRRSDLLFEANCLVCSLCATFVEISCPAGCGASIHVESGPDSDRTCQGCRHVVTAAELSDVMDTERSYVTINCAFCNTKESVVRHGDTCVCTKCIACGDAAECEWCNEWQLGDDELEFSGLTGCDFCYGHPEVSRFDDG